MPPRSFELCGSEKEDTERASVHNAFSIFFDTQELALGTIYAAECMDP